MSNPLEGGGGGGAVLNPLKKKKTAARPVKQSSWVWTTALSLLKKLTESADHTDVLTYVVRNISHSGNYQANCAWDARRKSLIFVLTESRKHAFLCCTYRWEFSRACGQDVLDLWRWYIRCAHHAECCPLCYSLSLFMNACSHIYIRNAIKLIITILKCI